MRRLLLTVSAFACIAGTAAAADFMEPIIADVAPAFDWTGFYGGVAVGVIRGTFDTESTPATHELDDFTPLEGTGWMAGVDIGADWQMDGFVLGINGEANWTNLEQNVLTADPEWYLSLDWYAALSGRAGVALDRALFYGKAGVVVAGMTLEGYDNVEPSNSPASASNTNVGWLLGVGAEMAVSDNVSIFAEYQRLNLGAADYDITATGYHAVESLSATADVVKVGVHLRQ